MKEEPKDNRSRDREAGPKKSFFDRDFWIRVLNIVIIVAAILYYNQIAGYHKQLAEAKTTIDKLTTQLEEVQKQSAGGSGSGSSSGTGKSAGKYKDGSYSGSAQGYGGPIKLTVTVSGGQITNINVDDASGETAAYYNNAVSMLDVMIQNQTWDVDTVSGATYSSRGLKNAAKQALGKAGKS